MPFSIIANIHTQAQVEITSQTPTPSFMEAIAINYGGTAADYTYCTLTEEEYSRYINGDAFTLNWNEEGFFAWFRPVVSRGAPSKPMLLTLKPKLLTRFQILKMG